MINPKLRQEIEELTRPLGGSGDVLLPEQDPLLPISAATQLVVSGLPDYGEIVISGGRVTVTAISGTGVSFVDPIGALTNRVAELETKVALMEKELQQYKESLREEVIVLRTVDREKAKREIRKLFESEEVLYYSDIAKHLRFDLPMVVELCQELIDEGQIYVNTQA